MANRIVQLESIRDVYTPRFPVFCISTDRAKAAFLFAENNSMRMCFISRCHYFRFLLVELIHLVLNLRFDMCSLYLRLIIFSIGDDVLIDSETLLMTDFVNLKIKSAQSFGCAHRGRVYMRVFIEVSAHVCMSIYIYIVFKKMYIGI
jgi:hypothetical protein